MTDNTDLPEDLAKFRDGYAELFGTVPPMPAARFAFAGEVDPDGLRLIEQLRAHAFHSNVFDTKTTNLILFGMLLVERLQPAAQVHAFAARRAGATWEELQKVVELASATGALAAANMGSAMLQALREKEKS
ncbi:MAG TPA: carboxymuconolactone decarboxylase family protein [Xanthobacteraceae bacterium]|nr:carboxymuconolactone decarboxylase family protein [Xanthobacteraceae bacterium]